MFGEIPSAGSEVEMEARARAFTRARTHGAIDGIFFSPTEGSKLMKANRPQLAIGMFGL